MNQPIVTRSVLYRDPIAKARWLDAMCTLDARLPLVREIARRFAVAADPNDPEALARDLHAFVRDAVKYVRDPAGEELSDAQVILDRGFGDCDDKARAFVALCRSVGIPARIRPVFKGDDFVHVQAEVKIGGRVLPAELIVRDLPLGVLPTPSQRILQ